MMGPKASPCPGLTQRLLPWPHSEAAAPASLRGCCPGLTQRLLPRPHSEAAALASLRGCCPGLTQRLLPWPHSEAAALASLNKDAVPHNVEQALKDAPPVVPDARVLVLIGDPLADAADVGGRRLGQLEVHVHVLGGQGGTRVQGPHPSGGGGSWQRGSGLMSRSGERTHANTEASPPTGIT